MISSSFPTLLGYILVIEDEWHQMQILRVQPQRCLQYVMESRGSSMYPTDKWIIGNKMFKTNDQTQSHFT